MNLIKLLREIYKKGDLFGADIPIGECVNMRKKPMSISVSIKTRKYLKYINLEICILFVHNNVLRLWTRHQLKILSDNNANLYFYAQQFNNL